jgi:fructose-1-phosphate kinase PfkB-like protein
MSEPVLLVEKSAAIATLTLNRPQAKNALSHELRAALAEAVEQLEADPQVRVLILTGAGDAFCAGFLYGCHESLPLTESIYLAHACARASLLAANAIDGAKTLAELQLFIKEHR